MTSPIYTAEDFEKARVSGHLAAKILDDITPFIKEGASTGEIDRLCEQMMRDHGAIPATIGYKGYQKATCTSINHVICHGIPDDARILKSGDIMNLDVTVIYNGFYGDSSRMYGIGEVSVKAQKLMDVTYECLMRGIDACKPGAHIGDIGEAIQHHAEQNRFSVVRDFCGHGVGYQFHVEPQVPHFGKKGEGEILKPGMIFTIEPMINAGTYHAKILSDGWTAVTRDRHLSAQFEHMVGITDDGAVIFTLSPKGYTKPPYQ